MGGVGGGKPIFTHRPKIAWNYMTMTPQKLRTRVWAHAGWLKVSGSDWLRCVDLSLTFVPDSGALTVQTRVLVFNSLQQIVPLLPFGRGLGLGSVQLPLLDAQFVQLLLNSRHVQTCVQHVLGVGLLLFQLHHTQHRRGSVENMPGVFFLKNFSDAVLILNGGSCMGLYVHVCDRISELHPINRSIHAVNSSRILLSEFIYNFSASPLGCELFGTILERAQQTFSFSTRLVLCSLLFSRTVRASWCLLTSGCRHIKHHQH